MNVRKIVSGGQTGVDRAALNTAMLLGVPCGGWCPKGRRAEDGVIPGSYPLQETDVADYAVRTRKNVEDSDGTLILTWGPAEGGTALTIALAKKLGKTHMVVDLAARPSTAQVKAWLQREGVGTLNVAGPRASTFPEVGGHTRQYLQSLLAN